MPYYPRGTKGDCSLERLPSDPIMIEGDTLLKKISVLIKDKVLKYEISEVVKLLKIGTIDKLYNNDGVTYVLGIIPRDPVTQDRLIGVVRNQGWTGKDLLTREEEDFRIFHPSYVRKGILDSVRKFKKIHNLYTI